MANRKSALQKLNEECGFSSRRIAEACKIDVSGFLRIERGDVLPKRETARELHVLYRRHVPLGVIYDPTHAESLFWLTTLTKANKRELAFQVLAGHPELTRRRLDARRRR